MQRPLLALLLALLPVQLLAQATLDGAWKATFSTGGSDARTAEIKIAGSSGTWTTQPRPNKDKNDPCVGRSFPITVAAGPSGQVTIELKASTELSGCKDRKATLIQPSPNALEGKLDNGSEIRLVR
jgi:hypothetical protein